MTEPESEQDIPVERPLDFRGIVEEPLPSPRWALSRARAARNLAWFEHSMMLLGLLIVVMMADVDIKKRMIFSPAIPAGLATCSMGTGPCGMLWINGIHFFHVELRLSDHAVGTIQGVASHESAVALAWIWRMAVYECSMLLFGAVGRGFWVLIGKAEAFRRAG